ncbi:MAG: endonuclease/exonuclease/phosphatase family protein [Candidatus Dependentiae bacterium]
MKKILLTAILPILIQPQLNAAENAQDTLRYMTYNIRREGKEAKPERLWENRLPMITALLQKLKPDIMGLQEPTHKQIQDLQDALPHFAAFGESRGASWWGLGTDEANPILYNKEIFSLLEYDTFATNKLDGLWNWLSPKKTGWLPRICTWGKFKVNKTGQKFYLYNTHFDHMYPEAQKRCAHTIVNHIDTQNSDKLPVIVTGDFNTAFKDDIAAIFDNFAHVRTIAKKTEGPEETATGWDDTKPNTWIDHILVTKDTAEVLTYQVLEHETDNYPSDHRPVFADLNFKIKKGQ